MTRSHLIKKDWWRLPHSISFFKTQVDPILAKKWCQQLGDSTGEKIRESSHMLIISCLFVEIWKFNLNLRSYHCTSFVLSYIFHHILYFIFVSPHIALHDRWSHPSKWEWEAISFVRSSPPCRIADRFRDTSVPMSSWDFHLRMAIGKCIPLNWTRSVWAYNGWGLRNLPVQVPLL